jgi:hypothetical protein
MSLKFVQKIKDVLVSLFSLAIKRFFLFSFILLAVVFLLAGLIFYEYAYKVSVRPDAQAGSELRVNNALYQKVFSRFEEKRKAFGEYPDVQVSDPFIQ